MLTIRLSRIGKKKKPMYRLVISEKTKDPYGRALEILGTYNPFTKEVNVKQDRIKHWLSKGAGMSATVNNLLVNNKIIEGKKQKSFYPKKKKKEEAAPSTGSGQAAEAKKPVKTNVSPEKTEDKPKEESPKPEKKADDKPEVKSNAKEESKPEIKDEKIEDPSASSGQEKKG